MSAESKKGQEKTNAKGNQQEALPNILDYSLVGDRAVIFSLDNQVGGLVRALRIFQVIHKLIIIINLS